MAATGKSIALGAWIGAFERLAPRSLAFEWDKVGLQVGDPGKPICRVAIALEATEATIREAIDVKADLLVIHHPLLWEPLRVLNLAEPVGRVIQLCIQSRLAVYAAHTNWDLSPYSMTRHMGTLLGLKALTPVYPKPQPGGFKLVVFVPEKNLAELRRLMAEAGAGTIGNYTECSFSTSGTGTFFGEEGTQPTLGRPGQLESVEEKRLEMVVPRNRLAAVLAAMFQAHPYEEVAYDLYATEPFRDEFNLLWTGQLASPVSLKKLGEKVQKAFRCLTVRMVGDRSKTIRRVVLCSGSGKSLIRRVAGLETDAFITGDLDYHSAREAEALGLSVLDAGHFHTEKFFPELVANALQSLPELRQLKVRTLSEERDPFD